MQAKAPPKVEAPPPAPVAPAPVEVKPAPPPEVKKPEPKKAEAKKEEPVKATSVKEDTKGKKRKTNGFKLFMSQLAMFGGFGALGYFAVMKGDEMAALKAKANNALLKVGPTK